MIPWPWRAFFPTADDPIPAFWRLFGFDSIPRDDPPDDFAEPPLSRVGVTFSDAQRSEIKALQEAGNIAGAQAVILSELRNQFGGAAAAPDDCETTPDGDLIDAVRESATRLSAEIQRLETRGYTAHVSVVRRPPADGAARLQITVNIAKAF